ncbi:MAG: hypothetical protein JRF60_11930 [Deltaproteobacteria bacterium]|jgi:hypothetical protein|nr:hypothetical protein [Deltaproteobacteria bacterium]
MQTEKTKDNKAKAEGTDFGCCSPENFQKMFEKMSKCFPGQGDATDFSAMKDSMMKKMMEMCCPPKATDTKEDTELQKEKEGETDSTEKEGCIS